MIKANDPSRKSWVAVEADSDFSIQNIPFGIFKTSALSPRVATAIGDQVLDLSILHEVGLLEGLGLPSGIFSKSTLNDFMELGKATTRKVRDRII